MKESRKDGRKTSNIMRKMKEKKIGGSGKRIN